MQTLSVRDVEKCIAGLFLLILIFFGISHAVFPPMPRSILSFGSTKVVVTIADTPETREKGLGGVALLANDHGMLFVFPRAEKYAFWMKDMRIPLDIIWLDEKCTIVDISKNISANSFPEEFRPAQPARYVLEVNALFAQKNGLKIGAQCRPNFTLN